MSNLIDKQAAIDLWDKYHPTIAVDAMQYDAELRQMSLAQPEIVRCKDCKYWNKGSCEYPEHAVNCQDYWVGDIETEAEHFCGYAERKLKNDK